MPDRTGLGGVSVHISPQQDACPCMCKAPKRFRNPQCSRVAIAVLGLYIYVEVSQYHGGDTLMSEAPRFQYQSHQMTWEGDTPCIPLPYLMCHQVGIIKGSELKRRHHAQGTNKCLSLPFPLYHNHWFGRNSILRCQMEGYFVCFRLR